MTTLSTSSLTKYYSSSWAGSVAAPLGDIRAPKSQDVHHKLLEDPKESAGDSDRQSQGQAGLPGGGVRTVFAKEGWPLHLDLEGQVTTG